MMSAGLCVSPCLSIVCPWFPMFSCCFWVPAGSKIDTRSLEAASFYLDIFGFLCFPLEFLENSMLLLSCSEHFLCFFVDLLKNALVLKVGTPTRHGRPSHPRQRSIKSQHLVGVVCFGRRGTGRKEVMMEEGRGEIGASGGQ